MKKFAIDFERIPDVGTTMDHPGQAYRLAATEPHKRRDGEMTTLLVWSTNCARCGDGFETRSPPKTNGLARRCSKCATPGRRVTNRELERSRHSGSDKLA